MSINVGDWTVVRCTTIGDGDLLLSTKIEGFASFNETVPAGLVWYSIIDANGNRESGSGNFDGISTITRDSVDATLFNGVYNGANPLPIELSGVSTVSCTMNARAFNDSIGSVDGLRGDIDANTLAIQSNSTNISSNASVISTNIINIDNNASDILQNIDDISENTVAISLLDTDVSLREASISAMENIATISGGVSQSGNTAVFIEEGTGEIVDSYTDPAAPTLVKVAWDDITFDLLANGGMPVLTGLGSTTVGMDSLGVPKAYPGGMSRAQRRTAILLAEIFYVDGVISAVKFDPIVSNQIGNLTIDLMDFIKFENFIKGLIIRPTINGDMTLWRDSGAFFNHGINYINALNDQNVKSIVAAGSDILGVFFNLVTYNNGNTGIGALVNQVPTVDYEPGGAGIVTPVGNGKTTIHYMYELIGTSSEVFLIGYGQEEYDSHEEAVTNLFADRLTHLEANEFEKMLLLGQIVVDKGATTWGAAAEMFPINSSSSSGSSGGSASAAINISYADVYGLGNNVQVALDSLAQVKMTTNQKGGMDAANAPTGGNPVATIADLTGFEPANPDISKTNVNETRSATIDMDYYKLSNALVQNSSEVAELVGGFGINYDFDMEVANTFVGTVDSNTTFTFSNPIAIGASFFIIEMLDGGSFTINWPTSVKWPGGLVPSFTIAGTDIIGFYTSNGGTDWHGFIGSLDSK